jgi:hypothetical protein
VIEMNVTEKNMAHVFRRDLRIAETGDDIVERGFRAGIEQGNAFIGFQRSCGHDASMAKLTGIENQRRIQSFDTAIR